jgi:hypothetical protein
VNAERTTVVSAAPGLAYEERLARDPRWALSEGSKYFEERSSLQQALQKIARRLDELHIPYAVAGGLALFRHGFRRFTDDVDILVTSDGLKSIHQELEGFGYLPVFAGSKNLRDTELGVRIEFLVTGQFPGDGQPKPVAFPDPRQAAQDFDGIKYVNLVTLIELKLASGMTNRQRRKDLTDVDELINALNLPADFANQLNPFVQAKYAELWQDLHPTTKHFWRIWDVGSVVSAVATIDDLIALSPTSAELLQSMKADGVTVDRQRTTGEQVFLTTDKANVARKYDMHEASEFFSE